MRCLARFAALWLLIGAGGFVLFVAEEAVVALVEGVMG